MLSDRSSTLLISTNRNLITNIDSVRSIEGGNNVEVKYEVTITAVGSQAREFLDNNSSVILLDTGKHPNLADMVVEHSVGELKADIEVGDKLKFGNTDFKVTKVGDVANNTIREAGHCTILVNKEGALPGQISVKGVMPPRLRVDDVIRFFKK